MIKEFAIPISLRLPLPKLPPSPSRIQLRNFPRFRIVHNQNVALILFLLPQFPWLVSNGRKNIQTLNARSPTTQDRQISASEGLRRNQLQCR